MATKFSSTNHFAVADKFSTNMASNMAMLTKAVKMEVRNTMNETSPKNIVCVDLATKDAGGGRKWKERKWTRLVQRLNVLIGPSH